MVFQVCTHQALCWAHDNCSPNDGTGRKMALCWLVGRGKTDSQNGLWSPSVRGGPQPWEQQCSWGPRGGPDFIDYSFAWVCPCVKQPGIIWDHIHAGLWVAKQIPADIPPRGVWFAALYPTPDVFGRPVCFLSPWGGQRGSWIRGRWAIRWRFKKLYLVNWWFLRWCMRCDYKVMRYFHVWLVLCFNHTSYMECVSFYTMFENYHTT